MNAVTLRFCFLSRRSPLFSWLRFAPELSSEHPQLSSARDAALESVRPLKARSSPTHWSCCLRKIPLSVPQSTRTPEILSMIPSSQQGARARRGSRNNRRGIFCLFPGNFCPLTIYKIREIFAPDYSKPPVQHSEADQTGRLSA
jgi:hypothetical protein